jgi:cytochrome P450
MRPGDRIFLATCAANRDPAHFAEPDRLDLSRSPNPHLGFGFGLHHCLGAPLARLEASIALQAIVQRFPDLTLAAPLRELTWHPTLVSRSLAALPVHLGADVSATRGEHRFPA